MNTTRSISDPRRVPYAVVGGAARARVRRYLFPVSIVILNRGGKMFREQALEELAGHPASELLVVEGPAPVPEIDSLARQYPAARFLLIREDCTPGEKVNLAVAEAQAPLVFVVWSDMRIPRPALSPRILEKVGERGFLCTLPVLKNSRLETIPSLYIPGYAERRLRIVPWHPLYDGMKSAFAFDYAGLYDKEKFRFSGGYDGGLVSPYWQKADFGFRSFLWGEEIAVNTSLYCQYRRDPPVDDNTPDDSYKFFCLKNVMVDFRLDRGVLGFRSFPKYLRRSGSGLSRGWREFRASQRWVWENRYRFKTDVRSLVDLWPVPE